MDPLCLLVAGAVRASLPASEFTLEWQHSVEKVRWEERYRVEADHLLLVEARVRGSGAGMEPPPGAVLEHGVWTWQPQRALPEVRVTHSRFAADYRLCWRDACRDLGSLTGPLPDGTAVVLRPCATAPPVSPPR